MAPFQSPATIARLPAAKSGSRAAQSAVSTIDPMVEQIGHASAGVSVPDTTLSARAGVAARSCRAGAVKKYDAGTAASTPTTAANRIERISIVVPLAGCRTGALGSRSAHPLPRRFTAASKGLGLADFHPTDIGVLGHLGKLSEICRGLLGLICGFRGLGCAVQAAQPVGRRYQRGLVFRERWSRLLLFEQQVAQQFAHRVEPVLHRDVLFAVVLQVRRRAHKLQRRLLLPLCSRHPGRCSQHLDFDLRGPIRLTCVFKRGTNYLEIVDVALGSGEVAAEGRSHGAGEMSDSLGLWKLAAPRLKRSCLVPRLAFQRKARRHRRKRRIAAEEFKPELPYRVAVIA